MNVFKRLTYQYYLGKIKKSQSFLLFGPRQTGKTTLLESVFSSLPQDQVLFYALQLPTQRGKIEADPEIILREVAACKKKPVFIFIDEIQKVPRVLDVLQHIIDKKLAVVAATGSSARKLRVLGTNWLPGRIHKESFYPLMWEEIGLEAIKQDLPRYLLCGTLPAVAAQDHLDEREKYLQSYTQLYLEEEIRQEALVRNIPRFSRFLEMAALESGTAPNFSKMASHLGTSHTSVREFFQILENTLISHRIDAFGTARDQVIRASRYYFFDLGVRNATAKIGHAAGLLPLQQGVLFEHFIILELKAGLSHRAAQFHYWRTKQGQEVDLILDVSGKRFLIEIKHTDNPGKNDVASMMLFAKKYDYDAGVLVCRCQRRQKLGDFMAIPWWELNEWIKENLAEQV